MTSKDFETQEPRNIIKINFGIVLASLHTLFLSLCIVLAFYYYHKPHLDTPDRIVFWFIALVNGVVIDKTCPKYRTAVFCCYWAACLLQIYLPLRALVQPPFMAGKAQHLSFVPLIIASSLIALIQVLNCLILGKNAIPHVILFTALNTGYTYAVYKVYTVEEAERFGSLKPWKFEELELPIHSESKNKQEESSF